MTSLDYDSISQTAIIVNQLKAEHHLCGQGPKIYSDPRLRTTRTNLCSATHS
jgi:hypothetical protein